MMPLIGVEPRSSRSFRNLDAESPCMSHALVRVLRGNRADRICVHMIFYMFYVNMYIYKIYIKRFIVRNWLILLGSPTSPKICWMSQQDGDTGLWMA